MSKLSRQTEEQISTAAAKAVLSVQGVGCLVSVPIQYGLRAKELFKGIAINSSEEDIVFDIFVNMNMGTKIPQTAFAIQEAVKSSVNTFIQNNIRINIHVQGIDFKENEKN